MHVHHDVLIRGATIIDGTGAPRYVGDVAMDDDKITRVGSLDSLNATLDIRADGLILAPGFIDAHTHDDGLMLSGGDMAPKVSQGVTTVIGGNCGCSLAPMPRAVPNPVPPPLDLLGRPSDWVFKRFSDYVTALSERPAAINCAMLVGHNTLRVAVMSDLERPATGTEIATMRDLVDQSLEDGAIGVSTGLAYAPAVAAPPEEVIEICRPLHDHGSIYCTHMRDEGDRIVDSLLETFQLGSALNVPVNISHHKLIGVKNHGRSKETLELIAERMASQQVCLDCYPYTASSTVLLRGRVETAKRTTITWSKAMPQYAGWDLEDIVDDMKLNREDVIDQLQPAGAVYHNMDDSDVERILAFGPTMIGSDGLPYDERPHPRLWGTFPRVLGHYSRDLRLFSLETAIHKMTGLTASNFGLTGRGVIKEGAFADITLFNPEVVIDAATYVSPTANAVGIETVFVNGKVVWSDNNVSGLHPGRFLHRGSV